MNNKSATLTPKNIVRNKFMRYSIMLIVLIFCLFFLFKEAHHLKDNDFVTYWSVARINLIGSYPPDELLPILEKSGWSSQFPTVMFTPPWVLPLIMLFVFFELPISQLIWMLFNISALFICANQIWQLYGGQAKQRWIAWVGAFVFAPTIAVLEKGQITPILLIGITGFLYFTVKHRNDWAAGIFCALLSIKPQVIYIFWIALLFWMIQQRRWLILVSTGISVLFMTLIAVAFNPHIIHQYFSAMQTYQTSEWANPAIGSYLRYFWLGTDQYWPQFIPAIFGGLWFLYYWYIHHTTWQWINQLPLILLVSVITTPYAWTYDYVILIPAIIQAIIWLVHDWKRWSVLLLACLFIGLNILDLVLHMKLNDFWFIWLAPGLLIWYLFTNFISNRPVMNPIKIETIE